MIKLTAPYELKYATPGSAGVDIQATHTITIYPGQAEAIRTGVYIHTPQPSEYYIDARLRSSLAVRGLRLANGAGVIDSDYTGEIILLVDNHTDISLTIGKGSRIGQLILTRFHRFEGVDVADVTRNDQGFGSTGA